MTDDTWKGFQAKLRKSGVLSAYAAQELLAQEFVQQQQQQKQQKGDQDESIHKTKRTDIITHNRVRRSSSIEDVSRGAAENISSNSFCQDNPKLPPSNKLRMMRQSFHLAFLKRPDKSNTSHEKIQRQEKFESHVLQATGIQHSSEFYPSSTSANTTTITSSSKRRSSFCLGSRELSNNKSPLVEDILLDAIPYPPPGNKSWNTTTTTTTASFLMNPKDEIIQLSESINSNTIQLNKEDSNDEDSDKEKDTTKNIVPTVTTTTTTNSSHDPTLLVDFPVRRRLSLPSTKNGRQQPRKSIHVLAPTVVSNEASTMPIVTKPIISNVEMLSVRNLKTFQQQPRDILTSETQESMNGMEDSSSMYDDSSTRNHDYFN